MAEASDRSGEAGQEAAQREIEALQAEVLRATGLGGRNSLMPNGFAIASAMV